jgi:2-oxoisovalerate dehydrogenase E2 component (dihydrolipoyl transacylase)
MGTRIVKLPDIGEGIAEAELVGWLVEVGEMVREDQPLAEVMTDKATVEVPSPCDGTVLAFGGEVGERLAVGSELIRLTVPGAEEEQREAPREPAAQPPPQAPRETARPLASPALRQRARDAGVDLRDIPGSGPEGRITDADLAAALRAPAAALADGDGTEEIRVTGLRRRIAERMAEATRRVAHFSYVEEVDVTALEELRVALNTEAGERPKLTPLAFLMRALVRAIADHPLVNAHFDDEAGVIRRFRATHLGIATQTEAGLMVPVVRHAERLDLWGCAAAARQASEAARLGTAKREDLGGSTITLSSLGALGGIASTPVINLPEVAIIGVNRIVVRPAWRDGVVVPRRMMNLSSSFDHRVVDGHDAAAFIQRVRVLLETPALLFVEG